WRCCSPAPSRRRGGFGPTGKQPWFVRLGRVPDFDWRLATCEFRREPDRARTDSGGGRDLELGSFPRQSGSPAVARPTVPSSLGWPTGVSGFPERQHRARRCSVASLGRGPESGRQLSEEPTPARLSPAPGLGSGLATFAPPPRPTRARA